MPGHVNGVLRFEEYEIDRARWQLRHRDELLPLSRKTFDLLIHLVEHADSVVSKDELLRALWPDSFVEESNLTQHVFLLRKALCRHESGTKIIETVPGRGYRFAVPVEVNLRPALQGQTYATPIPGTHEAAGQTPPETNGEGSNAGPPPVHQAGPQTAVPDAFPTDHASKRKSALPALRWFFLFTAAGIVLALLAGLYVNRSRTPMRYSVSTYSQITHDGHAKSIGGTDGRRIYFTQIDKDEVDQVSIAGGVQAPLPVAIKDPWSGDVSPDGSTLLVVSQADGEGPAASLWSLHLIGGSRRQLGYAIASAWSPDGERIVYASAGGELAVMRSDGSDKHQIAATGGYVKSIAWSPDGNTIRFARDGLLWQISPDGSHLHQLLPGWGKSPTQWNGEWAPDGRFFFVADGQIWLLESGRGLDRSKALHPIQLTFGPVLWDRPISSLDGKRLFASGRVRRGELVRLNPKSARFEAFLAGMSVEFVTYSRDKKSVAYVSYPEGSLWRADVDGSNPVQLTDSPVHAKSVCWSPDGSRLAFVNRTENDADAIFLIAADGNGKPYRLLPNDHEPETDPSWSPDGQHIAFATSPNVGASARSDLRTLDLATGKVTVIPASEGLLVPRWSPDGRILSAMTLDTAKMKLFDLASAKWSTLDTGPVAFPEWSHDGRWIIYVGGGTHPAILRIHAADGKREVVSSLGGMPYTGTYTAWMSLDPDDNPMMLRDEGTDEIYALTLDEK